MRSFARRDVVSRPMRWPADAPALHEMLAVAWARSEGCASLHPGDLYWRTAIREIADFQVWEDHAGCVVGFVEQDPSDASCDIAVHPEYPHLEIGLFRWAEEAARRRGSIGSFTVGCFDGNQERNGLLVGLGYHRTDHYYPHFLRPLDHVEAGGPPPGYETRSLRGPDEVAQRVELGRLAFGRTVLTPARYEALRAGPGHDAGLDLVAVDEGGRLAAFCLCWHDPLTRTGEFEPVGCHPDHRRRGLARAVIEEGLRRLRDRGAEQAVVTTGCANAGAQTLYRSMGFRVLGRDYDYAKPLA